VAGGTSLRISEGKRWAGLEGAGGNEEVEAGTGFTGLALRWKEAGGRTFSDKRCVLQVGEGIRGISARRS